MDCNLEKRYQEYLEAMGLKEELMGEVQKDGMRMTFMAASSIMLDMIVEGVANYSEEEFEGMLDNIQNQLNNYLLKKQNRLN